MFKKKRKKKRKKEMGSKLEKFEVYSLFASCLNNFLRVFLYSFRNLLVSDLVKFYVPCH